MDFAPNPVKAMYFDMKYGLQYVSSTYAMSYAWVVQSGNVDAVPVPAAAWLFGSGLIGVARRKNYNDSIINQEWRLRRLCENKLLFVKVVNERQLLSNNSFQVDFIVTILIQNLSYLGLAHHWPILFRLFTQSGPIALCPGKLS